MNFQKMIVRQKSMTLAEKVYEAVRFLPKEELFALSYQMRRAAVSVPSNIAEGVARATKNDTKYFLTIARGSVAELQTHILICKRLKYIEEEQARILLDLADEIRKMLSVLINKENLI